MSEPIPESIPTSADPRSARPLKKQRSSNPVRTGQAQQVSALFAKPDREIRIPPSSTSSTAANKSSLLPAPPEIVANVQGSSAGAGSGEFHVYKASRRREYERLRLMDEEVRIEEEEKAARLKREEVERRDRERTERNRAKREKARLRKERAKMGRKNGGQEGQGEHGSGSVSGLKKLVPNPRKPADEEEEDSNDGSAPPNAAKKDTRHNNDGKEGEREEEEDVLNAGGEVKNADEIGLVIEDDD